MVHRTDKLNEQLKFELANLILEYIPMDNALITVTYVICSPDLKSAKVGISVLPDNLFGTALKKLNSLNREFSGILRKKLKIRIIPKFRWEADIREKEAAKIEDLIKKIKDEDGQN